MMKKPKTKQIKSKLIEEWIQVGRAVLRNDIRPEYMEGLSDYYLLDDVGLLIRDTFEWKNATLYEKYSEYLDFINGAEKRAKRAAQHPIAPDASFLGHIHVTVKEFETMIAESDKILETKFSISPDVLDYSLSSLIYLDKSVKKMLKKFDVGDFEEKYAVLITAYCGEVMRRTIDGEWKITGNSDGILEQILILEKNKNEYSYRPEIPLALLLSGMPPVAQTLKLK